MFLWFGINQIFDPIAFIGYVPDFISSVYTAVLFNGIFELIFGLMLLFGYHTKIASLVLGIHLFTITLSLGYNEIAVRDLGLTLATFAIMLGEDKW